MAIKSIWIFCFQWSLATEYQQPWWNLHFFIPGSNVKHFDEWENIGIVQIQKAFSINASSRHIFKQMTMAYLGTYLQFFDLF